MQEELKKYKTSFIQRNFKQHKIAQIIYENFLVNKLKKYPKIKHSCEFVKSVLHVNTAVNKGGAAKVAYDFLCKSLKDKGLSTSILAEVNYGPAQDDIKVLKHHNKALHKVLHKYSKSHGLLDFYNLSSFDILNYDQFTNADVIHLHNLHGAYFSPFVLPEMTSKKPVVWTLHDEQSFTGHCAYSFNCTKWLSGCGECPDLDFYPKIKTDTTEFLLQLKKKIYDLSDFTVACPSHWLANRAKKSILNKKDIRVIYNGIDEKVFTPTAKSYARKLLNLPINKKILLFSASGSIHNPQKGGKYIIEAYNRLKSNDDYVFVNLGCDKPSKKKNWIDIPYIHDEKQLALYYSAADLFIYPSQAEVFGLVIAEAMSCQTPVIAFNNTAIPELVRHMMTGYLAENQNIDDFINGITTFITNNELRLNAGNNARELVLEKFTLDNMINQYLSLYNEVFERNKS